MIMDRFKVRIAMDWGTLGCATSLCCFGMASSATGNTGKEIRSRQ